MKIVLYLLYLFFGCFTIASIIYAIGLPVWIMYLAGGIWGFIIGTDANKRFE